ncbi:GNAT family N-acetyltransferase [Candidatus Dependentiae bacterium]|nr:GNAT family N-acetyltransferase [Candidatus Dependentiae bacterium]MCC7414831.1 GNAT family N-acetyltransferase [Campylobacterota bacterium]
MHTKITTALLNQYAYDEKPSFSKEEKDPSTNLTTRIELNGAGYITIMLLSDKQEVGRTILSKANYMEILQVNPAYRKHGYGKQLIAKAIAHCKAHKSPSMQWVAYAFNAYESNENGLSQPDLVAFYKRCGGILNSAGYFTLDLTQPAALALA